MSDRIGTLKNKLNYISPTNYRPTKEMLEKYENIWLPLRKKIKEQKKNNKKLFLIYGDFNIIEIKNNMINEITSNQSSKKSNSSTKKKSNTNSSSKKQTHLVKGKKRTWTISDK